MSSRNKKHFTTFCFAYESSSMSLCMCDPTRFARPRGFMLMGIGYSVCRFFNVDIFSFITENLL